MEDPDVNKCSLPYTGKWEWLSDSPSLLPPCEGAVSYYSQFGRVPGFTSAAGRRFRAILDEHLELLRWPEGLEARKTIRTPNRAAGQLVANLGFHLVWI